MNVPTAFCLALCLLSGCVQTQRDPLAARQKAYERIASLVEQGMTRRQLYALLPPRGKPIYDQTQQVMARRSMVSGGWETYWLDRDFMVLVSYLPATVRNRIFASAGNHGKPIAGAKRHYPSQKALSTNAIDALLGFTPMPKPSAVPEENPDDEVFNGPLIISNSSADRSRGSLADQPRSPAR